MAMTMIGTIATRHLCQSILLLTSLLALITCPHSKVEESFNLQASHDLFYHGLGHAWRRSSSSSSSFLALFFNVDVESSSSSSSSSSSCAVAANTNANDDGGEGRKMRDACELMDDDDLPYDHLKFPGVVPRTFTGPFVLSSIAKTISWIIPKQLFNLSSHPMLVQFLIRLELLLLSWMAHVRLANSLGRYFDRKIIQSSSSSSPQQKQTSFQSTTTIIVPPMILVSNYYLLITASQFHIPFYSSRLLPNTFALLLIIHAYAEWFNNKPRRTATYLVFATATFRCDVLLLLFTVGLAMLLRRQLSIVQAITTGVRTGVVSLLLTVPLDSLLWRRPIWPEFEVWWFNTVDNRSSEWGTQKWHWYFSKALPKGMLVTALLVPLAFVRLPEYVNRLWGAGMRVGKDRMVPKQSTGQRGMFDLCLLSFFAPVCGFVMMYSFLPHKEIRFIFPALPMFNACAAYGMSRLHRVACPNSEEAESKNKHKINSPENGNSNWIARGMYLCGIGAIACTMMGNLLFVRLSSENYPGGVALERLRLHLETSIDLKAPSPLDVSGNALKIRPREWENVRVRIDVAAAMTGVSLFGQRSTSYRYYVNGDGEASLEGPFRIDKSGYEEENKNSMENGASSSKVYTHLLTEQPSVDGYHVIESVRGHPRLDVRKFRIATQDAIFILERNGW